MAGENARFFYRFAQGGYEASARCTEVSHAMAVIATESHARQSRAMYPRQRAMGKFALKLAFKGYFERYSFMQYLNAYCRAMMDSSDSYHSPGMSVTVVGQDGFNFFRIGIPVSGMTEGDHVGSMVFEPVIVFESISDPLDTRTINEQTNVGSYSGYEFGDDADPDVNKFFYPFSDGSNKINTKAEDIYSLNDSAAGPMRNGTGAGTTGNGTAIDPGTGRTYLLGN